jgi:hypothetical protein
MLLMTGAFLIALVVGLSRLYLAAHWMTDVLAGLALAGVWGCLLIIPYLVAENRAPARTLPTPDAQALTTLSNGRSSHSRKNSAHRGE